MGIIRNVILMTNKIVEEELAKLDDIIITGAEKHSEHAFGLLAIIDPVVWIETIRPAVGASLDRVADEAGEQEAKEIMARFDEMVTLTAKDFERSDIVNFRGWLRRRLQQLSKGK